MTGLIRGLEETQKVASFWERKKLEKRFSSDQRTHHGFVAALLAALMRSQVHLWCVETVLIGDNFNTC